MSNIMIHNEEHREALQNTLDEKNKEQLAQFNGKYDHKFKAVEQALQILSDNDIRCYIFASLPSLTCDEKEGVWQYNNHAKYIEYKDGISTIQTKVKTGIFNTLFLGAVYTWLRQCIGTDIPASILGQHVVSQYRQALNWLHNNILPEQVQQLLDNKK